MAYHSRGIAGRSWSWANAADDVDKRAAIAAAVNAAYFIWLPIRLSARPGRNALTGVDSRYSVSNCKSIQGRSTAADRRSADRPAGGQPEGMRAHGPANGSLKTSPRNVGSQTGFVTLLFLPCALA